jgi:hypothetical protein
VLNAKPEALGSQAGPKARRAQHPQPHFVSALSFLSLMSLLLGVLLGAPQTSGN